MSQISLPLGAKVVKLEKMSKISNKFEKASSRRAFDKKSSIEILSHAPFRVTRNIKNNFQYPKSNSTFDSNKNKSCQKAIKYKIWFF